MYGNRPHRQPMGFGLGSGPPPPRDVLVLLGVIFFTFTLQWFDATAIVPRLLELSPAVWLYGFVWQLATYAFVGQPMGPIWFLVTLLILFWFGRDVYRALGRKGFWRTIAWGVGSASVSAVFVAGLWSLVAPLPLSVFSLIQGQAVLVTVLIAAFATLYGNATILLMFILPVRARWFLWLEIAIAFLVFLGTKDLPGFVGVCAAVGTTYSLLAFGGPQRALKEWRLRLERRILELKMRRLRAKRGFRVVETKDDDNVHRGPWIN